MAYQTQILVVATRTAACPELIRTLTRRCEQSAATLHLLVPATPHGWAWLADMHSGGPEAERYLELALERYRGAGLEVGSARLGDPDPLAAVMDAVHFTRVDEIVVSTLPRHLSVWLRLSLPHRVQAVTGLPVTHVVGRPVRLARPRPARALVLDETRPALGTEGARR